MQYYLLLYIINIIYNNNIYYIIILYIITSYNTVHPAEEILWLCYSRIYNIIIIEVYVLFQLL